ncbi:MAG: DUF58 domain-containing protein [Gemmatales bacterium]|nr:DUF58 domain-containing protein [Gemmatales bacterium]MDW8385450.1 DUF58 domain-containing protein [Gemmatales bacterium]
MRWYVVLGLLIVAALVLQMGLLVYALSVLLAILLLSRYLANHGIENLHVERQCVGESARVGDVLTVRVTVTNRGKLPLPWVLIEDVLPPKAILQRPPRLKVEGRRIRIAMLSSGKTTTLRYEITFAMRGYYQIGPVLLETGDLFGFYRRYRIGAAPHFVLVVPKPVPMSGYDLASRRPIGEIRLLHKLYEDPTRIAGVRLYQTGDPLNRVHWRATARTMTLHSKVYEPSTIAGGTIVLDLHRDAYPARGEPYRSELAVTAAASLANTLCQLNQQVGLITNGRDAAERIRLEGWEGDYRTRRAARQEAVEEQTSDRLQPLVVETRRSAEQLQRILETLGRVELTDGLRFPDLVFETSHRMPRDATVIAVLGSVPPEIALTLGNLCRQGYAVTAILVLFEDKAREVALARLLQEGVEVRHFQNEEELSRLCERVLIH